ASTHCGRYCNWPSDQSSEARADWASDLDIHPSPLTRQFLQLGGIIRLGLFVLRLPRDASAALPATLLILPQLHAIIGVGPGRADCAVLWAGLHGEDRRAVRTGLGAILMGRFLEVA